MALRSMKTTGLTLSLYRTGQRGGSKWPRRAKKDTLGGVIKGGVILGGYYTE